ncbi:MAG: cell division protein FtsA [Proteobacteria bacterium]|nr:cell division protein FtsA [Pseudomonadota bacterium]
MRDLRQRHNIIAGLDIGSSKVCCFIAELDDFSNPRVIGYGVQASHGMKRGMIVDMDQTERAIREAVHQAEEMAGVEISAVYVGVGGVHLTSHMTDGLIVLGQHEITDADLDKVVDVACAKQLEGDRQIIHALATAYVLDNQKDIRDPRGMTGARLESEVHIISAAKASVRNIQRCVERCNLEVAGTVVEPYASALATLVEDEKELGVCMVDVGGGTCDIAIFDEGALLYTAVVPIGGNHITSDIARGLSTPLHHAERIKTLYGCAMASMVEGDENIDIPHVGEDEETMTGHITRGQLAGIIQPRCEEILEMVRGQLEKSGYESVIGRRIVLTGGTSQLRGIKNLAEIVLDKTVRIAKPVGLEGLTGMSGIPQNATAAGLILFGARQASRQLRSRRRESPVSGWVGSLNRWLRESFQAG